jgi:hypothetical protein
MNPNRSAVVLRGDSLRKAIAAEAEELDLPNLIAAIHVLNATGLADVREFAERIHEYGRSETDRVFPGEAWRYLDGERYTTHLTPADRRLIQVAQSLAIGHAVNLRGVLEGLSDDQTRRVAEAILITASGRTGAGVSAAERAAGEARGR